MWLQKMIRDVQNTKPLRPFLRVTWYVVEAQLLLVTASTFAYRLPDMKQSQIARRERRNSSKTGGNVTLDVTSNNNSAIIKNSNLTREGSIGTACPASYSIGLEPHQWMPGPAPPHHDTPLPLPSLDTSTSGCPPLPLPLQLRIPLRGEHRSRVGGG